MQMYDHVVSSVQSASTHAYTDPAMGFIADSTVVYDVYAAKVASRQTVRNCFDLVLHTTMAS